MLYSMKNAVKSNRLEHALADGFTTLAVRILSDGKRPITLVHKDIPLAPFFIEDEKTEKMLLVNLVLIARNVREKIPKPDENPSFLSRKAGSFSGVAQRTVQAWCEQGVVIPGVADTSGTGQRRLYSVTNCIEIGIVQSLAKEGLNFKLIREIMSFLRGDES